MFFFYIIMILIILLVYILIISKIQIHIQNVRFLSNKEEGRYLNKNYKIEISINIFNKINILKINLTKDKIEKEKIKTKFDEFGQELLKRGKKFDIETFDIIKIINPKINNMNLNINIGLEDASICAVCTGTLSAIIAIFLKNIMNEEDNNFWQIEPVYQDKNFFSIKLDCLITFKVLNILKSIIKTKKSCLNKKKMGII